MIIGVTGNAGHGKDEVARAFLSTLNCTRIGLADPVRRDVLQLDPLIEEDFRLSSLVELYGWEHVKRTYPEVRRLLRTYSTDLVRRGFGETAWADRLLRENPVAREAFGVRSDPIVVVPDVRFPSEVLVLRPMILLHVVRPDGPVASGHESEQQVHAAVRQARHLGIVVREIVNDADVKALHNRALAEVGSYL